MMKTLFPHQSELTCKIENAWAAGFRNVLAVLPTGGGKSIIVSNLIYKGVQSGLKQAVIAHRNELVGQMSMHLADCGIYHRIIGSKETVAQITRAHRKHFKGQCFINPSSNTAVVGVDTLISRADKLKAWAAQIDRWVIDEAHHVLKNNKWGEAVELFVRAYGLGVTATPQRADGMGLGRAFDGVFDEMVLGLTMRELIDMGKLSEYEIVCPISDLIVTEDDITKTGDYSFKKMKKAAERSHIVGDVVDAYVRHANNKQAICFATDIETAGKIADKFNKAGIRAASLSSKTNTAVRDKYVEEFKQGKLLVLVNVDLFDEGFDVPACECVIMARPTASLGKYLQMVGRCLRSLSGKLYGLIIDHVGNVVRHGLPDKHRGWTLSRRDKRGKQEKCPDDIPLTSCKSSLCGKPYESFRLVCPYCGSHPPLPATREPIKMVHGDLILLDRETLAKLREQTVIESPEHIGARVAFKAGEIPGRAIMNKQIEKIESQRKLSEAIAQWAAIERMNGITDQEAYRKFFLTTGMDVLSALSAERTRQEFDEMATRIQGWYL